MTGDAPQPGETPRDDGTPWAPEDLARWRADEPDPAADRTRSPHRRAAAAPAAAATPTLDPPQPAQHTGEAAEAHRAGAEDMRVALAGEPAPGATAGRPVPDHPAEGATRPPAAPRHAHQQPAPSPAPVPQKPAEQAADDKGTERDHDQVDAQRFNTQGQGTVYAARDQARPAGTPEPEATIVDLLKTVPAEPPPAENAQDVMLLPEPDRNRPTVALDLTAVPGQPPSGLSRLDRAQQDRARADRALQDRVRQERTAALLETSPFWKAEEERRAHAQPPAEIHQEAAGAAQPPRRRAPQPRRPASGLLGLLALGLVATFFAWVSAEPFWLAVGHGDRGTATVGYCAGSGITQRCTGQFTAANGAYRVDGLALFGVEPGHRAPGASSPARMVSSESRQAYVGGAGMLMHLRWTLSLVLVLLCGLGIAGLTGVRRLNPPRVRRGALLVSMAGPLVLLAGFLCVTY